MNAFILFGCTDKSYPENLTKSEREEYYETFNASRTDEEWEEIRSQSKEGEADTIQKENSGNDNQEDLENSIPFSIKNNSILYKRLRIADNVLAFKPFETRYVGFKPATKVYLIRSNKEDRFLFKITQEDQGKTFKIAE